MTMPRSAAILAAMGSLGLILSGTTPCASASNQFGFHKHSTMSRDVRTAKDDVPLQQAGAATRMTEPPADMTASRAYAIPVRITGPGPHNGDRIGYLHTGPHLSSGSYPIYASAEGGSILGIVTLDASGSGTDRPGMSTPTLTGAVLTGADGKNALVESVTMFGASKD